MIQLRTVLLLVVFTLLTGCGALRPSFETPTVTVSSFKTLPSGGIFPEFEIGLNVTNPNPVALELAGIAYTIDIDGSELIKGVASELPLVPAYGKEEVKLTASADLLAGARVISDLLRSGKDRVNYAFEAKLDLSGWQPTIRVRDEGEISLQP